MAAKRKRLLPLEPLALSPVIPPKTPALPGRPPRRQRPRLLLLRVPEPALELGGQLPMSTPTLAAEPLPLEIQAWNLVILQRAPTPSAHLSRIRTRGLLRSQRVELALDPKSQPPMRTPILVLKRQDLRPVPLTTERRLLPLELLVSSPATPRRTLALQDLQLRSRERGLLRLRLANLVLDPESQLPMRILTLVLRLVPGRMEPPALRLRKDTGLPCLVARSLLELLDLRARGR